MVALTFIVPAAAEDNRMHRGPLIAEYGKIPTVDNDLPLPKTTVFKVVWDGATRADRGGINRTLDQVARFLNMHVEAGVPAKNIHLAVVFHGPALYDLTLADAYARGAPAGAIDVANANAPLVAILMQHGVEFYVCGYSAAVQGIKKSEFLPGVKMTLSAMSAHAVLQQRGYTLNPF